jgi:magnesium chelatase accessory protein
MHHSPLNGEFPAGSSLPPSDWPDRIHSEFLTHDGIRWHVQRWGDGPLILLLHGTGGGTHSWAAVTPHLAASYRILSIDLPGHAFSFVSADVERAQQPFSLPGMARVVGRLLAHLGEQPIIALGHSAGVAVLLRMALDGVIAPARIVGVCPALVAPPAWYITLLAPMIGALAERSAVADGAAQLASVTGIVAPLLASTGSRLTAPQMARYRALCAQPGHVHAALTMMAQWDLQALHRAIHALAVPLQLVAARGDRWIPLAQLSAAVQGIPHMSLHVEAGGHLLPEEDPFSVLRALALHGANERAP